MHSASGGCQAVLDVIVIQDRRLALWAGIVVQERFNQAGSADDVGATKLDGYSAVTAACGACFGVIRHVGYAQH